MITAKVKLWSKVDNLGGGVGGKVLAFGADYADGRNKEWAVATPNLHLQMVVSDEVAELFTPGQSFTLTFEVETPPAAADAGA